MPSTDGAPEKHWRLNLKLGHYPTKNINEIVSALRGGADGHSDRVTRGSAALAVVTDQAQALHTPDALRAGQDSDVNLREGPLPFGLHDAPSPSFDLCRVAAVHDDRSGTRGRPAIYEMSRFP